MSAPTTNGFDRLQAGSTTPRRHADMPTMPAEPPAKRAESADPTPPIARTRAISRNSINRQVIAASNFLQLQVGDMAFDAARGEVMTYRPPTIAEAWSVVVDDLRTSRWFEWFIDVPAALVAMIPILLVWPAALVVGASRARRQPEKTKLRRRIALVAVLAAVAVNITARIVGH